MILGLNRSELLCGAIYGLISCVALGWYGLFVCLLTSFLWALSGSSWRVNQKIFRRLGCPIAITLPFYFTTHLWWNLLTIPIHFAILSLGYGIPDSTDEGSFLGKFWLHEFLGNYQIANTMTRATIFLALSIGILPLLVRF